MNLPIPTPRYDQRSSICHHAHHAFGVNANAMPRRRQLLRCSWKVRKASGGMSKARLV
ncbi:hypothetical protein [Methylobacterium crusticola]|uniref:hypothetical protein n=1 Tax=Methylobacterium crusticola TaxID=1697972 RepID=UPI0013968B75|nr:hypothetical protein [Methylobacterium crusticola]